jgi:hypothetical protein
MTVFPTSIGRHPKRRPRSIDAKRCRLLREITMASCPHLIVETQRPVLEDHLYDDAIEYRSIPKGLAEALVRLSSNATVDRSTANLP